MLITEANVNHDRPGARPGKVGKLPRLARACLLARARDNVGRGIKAVINYAITRSYLKIKTVFFASMRLTDCHVALTALFLVLLPLCLIPSVFVVSLLLPPSFAFFLSHSSLFPFPSFYLPFSPIFKWQILRVSPAAKEMRHLHLFADSSHPIPPPPSPPTFCLSFSRSSASFRSFASPLSCGPRTPAGLFVTPVFPGIPDLELIFVGRKLCRSHP